MKWRTLKYEIKIKVLFTGTFLLLFLCYQYAFKKTWESYQEYNENKTKTASLKNYGAILSSVQRDEKVINQIIKSSLTDTLNSGRELLAFITVFCKTNQLWLTDYQPVQITENVNFNIATTQITVGGSYINLLKLLYEIENLQSYGRLCSALFKSTKDVNSGKVILKCTFFIQNLIRK